MPKPSAGLPTIGGCTTAADPGATVRQARTRAMVLLLRPLPLSRQTRTQGLPEEAIPLPVAAMLLPSGVPLLPRRGSWYAFMRNPSVVVDRFTADVADAFSLCLSACESGQRGSIYSPCRRALSLPQASSYY